MPLKLFGAALISVALSAFSISPASADFLLTFDDGDSFDGDAATQMNDATDQAGPFNLGSIQSAILTTRKINGVVASTEQNTLETNEFKLGIDSAGVNGGEKNNWNDGESWTFDFNAEVHFAGINLGGMTSGEAFTVQSDSFIGFVPVGALGDGVSFNSATGTFTFSGDANNDDFEVSDLGGNAAKITAGDEVTIAFSGGEAFVQSLTLSSAIPEPGSGMLIVVLAAGLAIGQRRRRS